MGSERGGVQTETTRSVSRVPASDYPTACLLATTAHDVRGRRIRLEASPTPHTINTNKDDEGDDERNDGACLLADPRHHRQTYRLERNVRRRDPRRAIVVVSVIPERKHHRQRSGSFVFLQTLVGDERETRRGRCTTN